MVSCGPGQDPATLKAAREAAQKKIKDNQDAKARKCFFVVLQRTAVVTNVSFTK